MMERKLEVHIEEGRRISAELRQRSENLIYRSRVAVRSAQATRERAGQQGLLPDVAADADPATRMLQASLAHLRETLRSTPP